MNKLKFWILGIITAALFSAGIAYAVTWSLPPTIQRGDLIVATSTTQAVRLKIGTSGKILQSNGSVPSWVATSTLGLVGSPAGSTQQIQFNNAGIFGANSNFTIDTTNNWLKAPINDFGGQVYNVKAYGAKGDGSTDDTATFNSAISAAHASVSKGGRVFIPDGNFKLSTSPTLYSNITFDGNGTTSLVTLASGAKFDTTGLNNVVFKNFSINGNSHVANTDYGIYLNNATNATVDHMQLLNMGGFGVFLNTSSTNTTSQITISHNYITGKGNNDLIGGGAGSASSTVFDVMVDHNFVVQDASQGNHYGTAIDIAAMNKTTIDSNITQGRIILGGESIPHYHVNVSNNTVRPPISLDYTQIAVLTASNKGQSASSSYISILNNQVIQGHIFVQGQSSTTSYTLNAIIANNNIETASTTASAEFTYGIEVNYVKDISITGNTIVGATRAVSYSNVNGMMISHNTLVNDTASYVGSGSNTGVQYFNNPGELNDLIPDYLVISNDGAATTSGFVVKRTGATPAFNVDTANTRVGIATTAPLRTLTVVGDIYGTGILYDSTNAAGSSGNFLMSTATGYQWTATSTLFGGTPITSTGTNGKVAIWTGASTLGNGALLDNGTVAGVSATSSTVNFNIQGTGTNNPFFVASSSGVSYLRVMSNGNVAIGSSTPPAALQVSGAAQVNAAGTAEVMTLDRPFNNGVFRGRRASLKVGAGTNVSDSYSRLDIALTSGGMLADSQTLPDVTVLTLQGNATAGINSTTPGVVFAVKGTTTLDSLDIASSSGASQLRVTSGGNVGVGTTTPGNALTVIGSISSSNLTSGNCVQAGAGGVLQSASGACGTGGSGNSAWTIGNGLIYNATSTDSVLVGTSTPTTATFFVQGKGGTNPFTLASSTGTNLVVVDQTGLATLTVADKGGQVYNVKAYGAKCDGVTDDTAAFNTATSSIGSTGATLLLPHGVCVISNTLAPPASSTIEGDYLGTTLRLKNTSNVNMITLKNHNTRVMNLYLDGNKANQSSGDGIEITNVFQPLIQNVYIDNIKSTGINSTGNTSVTPVSFLSLDHVTIRNSGSGINLDAFTQDSLLDNTYVDVITNTGITVAGNGTHLTNVHVYKADIGFQVNSNFRTDFQNCVAETNNKEGIKLSSAVNVNVEGCVLFSNDLAATGTKSSIFSTGSTGGVFSGNTIYDDNATKTEQYGIYLDSSSTNNTILDNFVATMASGTIQSDASTNSIQHSVNGKIGIGTTTPQEVLSVMGNVQLGSSGFIKSFSDNVLMGGNGFNTLFRPDSSGGVIQFQSFAGSTNTYFQDSGAVGLGTSSPAALLAVQNSAGSATPLFNVASSSNGSFFQISANGATTLPGTYNVASGTTVNVLAVQPTLTVATSSTASLLNVSPTINSVASITPMTALYMQNTSPTIVLSKPTTTITSYYEDYHLTTMTTGTVTSFYQLYLDKPSTNASTTITNGYALVVASSTMPSGFGSTSPTATLTVQGSAAQSPNLFTVASSNNSSLLTITPNGFITVNSSTPTGMLTVQGTTNFNTKDILVIATSTNANLFTVLANGNVLIGNPYESSDLFVVKTNSSATARMTFKNTGSGAALVNLRTESGGGDQSFVFTTNGVADNFAMGVKNSNSNFDISAGGTLGTNDRLTIDSTGNVGIASSTPRFKLAVNGTVGFQGLSTSGATQTNALCRVGTTQEIVGDTVNCIASAKRFKQDIQPLDSGLEEVMQLQPVDFYWKPEYNGAKLQTDPNYNGQQVGFIADEVLKLDPRLATVETASSSNGSIQNSPGMAHSVRYENMVALVVKAVQDMEKQILDLFKKDKQQDQKLQKMQQQLDQQQAEITDLKLELNHLTKKQ